MQNSAKDIIGIYALSLNPDSFLRASGELFAQLDSSWKAAKNRNEPVQQPIADFLAAALVHLDALELCGLHDEMLPAIVSILISIDMARVDTVLLGWDYVALNMCLVREASRRLQISVNDDFASSHFKAILHQAAALFLDAVSHFDGVLPLSAVGIAEGCKKMESTGPFDKSEFLVDIFARLHALN